MPLIDQLNADLKDAMRAKDERRLSVLRMLKAAISNWELAQGRAAADEDVLKLIGTQVKQRRDAAEQFRAGARAELAEKEDAEAVMLAAYLPEQLSDDEVRAIVQEAVAATGASSAKDLGKVMGAVIGKTKGRADGATVQRLVKEALG